MQDLYKITEIFRKGGVVIFPTDTAYAIGCRIDNKAAIKRLFKIKNRPEGQATPVLVDSISMAEKYLLSPIPKDVRFFMRKYWPGGLTIIYPCKIKKVPFLVRGGGKTLGVRMPDHKLVLSIIKNIGVPILGSSANFHGLPTPYTFDSLDKKLIKLADWVIKGRCQTGRVSTVVDCSDTSWKILRQGALRIKNL